MLESPSKILDFNSPKTMATMWIPLMNQTVVLFAGWFRPRLLLNSPDFYQ